MRRVLASPRAQRDIDELALKTAGRFGLDTGIRFLDEVHNAALLLAAHPQLGRERHELGPGIRSFPLGSVIIFYRPIKRGIEIARVLHGARDIPSVF